MRKFPAALAVAATFFLGLVPVRADLLRDETRLVKVKNGVHLSIRKGPSGESPDGWLTLGCDEARHPDCRWLSLIGVHLRIDWAALVDEARRRQERLGPAAEGAMAHGDAWDRGHLWTVAVSIPKDGRPTDDPGGFVWEFFPSFIGYQATFGPSAGASAELYEDMAIGALPPSGRAFTGAELKGGVIVIENRRAWDLEAERLAPGREIR